MKPVTRSLDKIVDDIVEELEPLRHDVEKTREAIRTAIANTRVMAPRIYKVASAASIKAKARVALRALDALMRAYPYLNDSAEFQHVRTWADLLARTTRTPHHNRDIFQEALTRLAKSLIEQFSQNPPSPTPTRPDLHHGNTHEIANFIYEAVTGQKPTKLQMARALHRAFATHEATHKARN